MRQIVVVFVIFVIIIGCESKEELAKTHEAELYKQSQQKQLQEIELEKEKKIASEALAKQEVIEEENQSTLSKLGITMDDGKVVIDTNKAKDFFGKLSDTFTTTSQKIDKELKEGNLTTTKDMGIEMNKESLTLDLNKTKDFFQRWGKKIEELSQEIELFEKSIDDKNLSKK